MDARKDVAGRRRLAFLLGNPVDYSLSPAIHNAAFKALGLNAVYRAVRIAPDELPGAIGRLREADALGANVTIPYKEDVLALLDDLTSQAKTVGAVNTIVVTDDGRLLGANTDIEGFLAPLASRLDELRGGSALIFGAGGVARAACFALLTMMEPSRITIVSRRAEQSSKLIADMVEVDKCGALCAASFDDARLAVRDSRLIVNATSVGMKPDSATSVWPNSADLHAGQIVYDLVYTPTDTRLIREATAHGATTLGGMTMLIAQAAASFKLWTGRELPLDAVRDALGVCRT